MEAFITCAVSGSASLIGKQHKVPITPKEIAQSAIGAAKAGAAIVHCHVRNPKTGEASSDQALYREVVARIKESGVDAIINLTAGMGGDLFFNPSSNPMPIKKSSDMRSADERLEHIEELLPDICTLDCGTINFGEDDYVMTNTVSVLRAMAKKIRALGVKPEIEIFDTGHLVFAKKMAEEGLFDDPILVQLCMGIPYGAPDDINTLMSLVNNLPQNWIYSMFSIGRRQLAYAALSPIVGGNIRVGLEDNLYLSKGVLATNEALVERAVTMASQMNCRILTASEVRDKLKLKKR